MDMIGSFSEGIRTRPAFLVHPKFWVLCGEIILHNYINDVAEGWFLLPSVKLVVGGCCCWLLLVAAFWLLVGGCILGIRMLLLIF